MRKGKHMNKSSGDCGKEKEETGNKIEPHNQNIEIVMPQLESEYVFNVSANLKIKAYYQSHVSPAQVVVEDLTISFPPSPWNWKKEYILERIQFEGDTLIEETRKSIADEIKNFLFIEKDRTRKPLPGKKMRMKTLSEVVQGVLFDGRKAQSFLHFIYPTLEDIVVHNAIALIVRGNMASYNTEWYSILISGNNVSITINYTWNRVDVERLYSRWFRPPEYRLSKSIDMEFPEKLTAGMNQFNLTVKEVLKEAENYGVVITERTLRYYQTVQLIPIPLKESIGGKALYSTGTVIYLIYISIMRDEGRKLEEIRDLFTKEGLIDKYRFGV